MRHPPVCLIMLHVSSALVLRASHAIRPRAPSPTFRDLPGRYLHVCPHDRRCQPLRAIVPSSSTLTASIATLNSPLQPAFAPIITIVSLCMAAMIPTALAALRPGAKLRRRWFTGCTLGAVVSLWIFSGTWAFLGVFACMAIVAQNEYFTMNQANGVYPTRKLGLIGSVCMYTAATSRNPILRDALFPITGTVTLVYLMLRRSTGIEADTPPLTMSDVSTTLMGIYVFGYMPSFWVRLRCLGPMLPSTVLSELIPATSSLWSSGLVKLIASSSADLFTRGALTQWWTMFSIVCADVAAYFAGKSFGKTPLIELSPRKTQEGFLGGCVAAMVSMSIGATLMGWPRPQLSGSCYGFMIAVMALIGDLTVSLFKRSAGVKDTGAILPGHGGLLDRIDSYLLVAAPAYFYVRWFLPSLMGI